MTELEKAEERLKKYNQEQIIEDLEKLDKKKQENIIKQINEINFDEVNKLYNLTKQNHTINDSKIEPIGYVDLEKLENKQKQEAEKIGEEIIRNNQYAVVTMAGGQGTRLGWKGPKGTYKLDIGENGKYIFEILAESMKKSKDLYNVFTYWSIMTSKQNDNETKAFFEENNYFGYDKEKVVFFTQGELPVLTESGKIVLEDGRIQTGSNGNGGVYKAMKDHHIIEDMKEKNIKWVYICGVDNIMVNPISPIFIGKTILDKLQIASKSVAKAYPEEKVGVFCRRNNKPSTVEYIELSEKMRNERDEYGELYYGEANIISHLLSIDAIEKITNFSLPYHIAKKKGLYKFETFIFDAFEYFDDMLVMRVKREDEFAPIKNKEGVDSPETAKKIYERNSEKNERIRN